MCVRAAHISPKPALEYPIPNPDIGAAGPKGMGLGQSLAKALVEAGWLLARNAKIPKTTQATTKGLG